MPNHICPNCKKEFYHKWTKRKFCSRKCWKVMAKIHDIDVCDKYCETLGETILEPRMKKKGLYLKIQRILEDSIFYKKSYKVQDMLVDYPDAPTGRAYVGFNKAPFMPNDNGIGFKGVLMQDENRVFVLNCETGTWHRKITEAMLNKLGLTTREYKEKYGLSQSTGLVGDTTSYKTTQAALKNKNRHQMTKAQQDKGKRWATKIREKYGRSVEEQNKHATCALQLKTRTYEFIRANRELPSQNNRGRAIYKAVRARYGSWGEGLVRMGLPYYKRTGTNVHFIFPEGQKYQFNINQMHDREELYKLIETLCFPGIVRDLEEAKA